MLNPQGVIPAPKAAGLNPRVGDLAGKKIVLAPNTKHGADLFLDEVAELLMSKYPTATITLLKPGVKAKVAAKQCDVFIHSTGD